MRFQVPQFINIEDKIFGALTFKQFIYLAGAAGACVVIFYVIPFRIIALMLMLPIVMFGFALAFYKVNNKPFIRVVEDFLKYSFTNKLYIWKHEAKKITPQSAQKNSLDSLLPKLSNSKLKDLGWALDVIEHPTKNTGNKI